MDLSFVIRQSVQYGAGARRLYGGRAALIVLPCILHGTRAAAGRLSNSLQRGRRAAVFSAKAADRRIAMGGPQVLPRSLQRRKSAERTGDGSGPLCRNRSRCSRRWRRAFPIRCTCRISSSCCAKANVFVPRYSHAAGRADGHPGERRHVAPSAPAAGREPLEIYLDKPPPWLRSLEQRKLQTLDFMRRSCCCRCRAESKSSAS